MQRRIYSVFICAALILFAGLAGCGGAHIARPPAAQIGDGHLAITLSTSGRATLPRGSEVIITLADVTGAEPIALGGDQIRISQNDRDVHVSFPLDKARVRRCGAQRTCRIYVRVVKGGWQILQNAKNTPYRYGQKAARIALKK